MNVRQAIVDDFEACAAIVPTVQSSHVWQLRLAYDPTAPHVPEELGATLSRTRLPRSVSVRPARPETLDQLWEHASDVLVAEHNDLIGGYVVLDGDDRARTVTIARLVVAPQVRRSGVGGALLRASLQWGRAFGYQRLLAHCAARNDPTASFYMRYGLRFAGYSEAFYPTGEVALFWQRGV